MEQRNPFATGIAVEVVRNGLAAIADEMAISHTRAAYSSVVRDLLDFSTAVCDGEGRVIAQGLSQALQLGAIPRLMAVLRGHVANPAREDVYLVNHPWKGGVHLPDFFFVKPVFLDACDRPAAYVVLVSHMVDVGGCFPGGINLSSASLWEEGLVIPPVPLVKRGVPNQALIELIAANTRDPMAVQGDIRAALAGLETGARQFRDLAERLGERAILRHIEDLLAATERATRAAFRSDIPDGAASASDFLDDEDLSSERHPIVCRVEKRGDRLSFDFTGSAPQLPYGINCNLADVMSAVAFAARAVLREEIPVNDGFYRCLEFVAPEGTVMNARHPAPVCGRGATIRRMTDVALVAMATLVPGRLPAISGNHSLLCFSGELAGKPWIFLDAVHAGWGGRPGGDGAAGLSHPVMNSANIPVEVAEQLYPVRVTQFALAADSGGAGRYMGAPGIVREYEMLAERTTFNVQMTRAIHVARGVAGGAPGSAAACEVRRGSGEWERIAGICTLTLNAGDRVRARLSSGGGYGEPQARSRERIECDLRNGLVTPEYAAATFGYAGSSGTTVTKRVRG